MSKTLGQVAFEALVVGYGENVDAQEWPDMSQATHDAWQAAAEAVEREVYAQHQALPPSKKAYAVIEAAQRWYSTDHSDKKAKARAEGELMLSLDALDSEEEVMR